MGQREWVERCAGENPFSAGDAVVLPGYDLVGEVVSVSECFASVKYPSGYGGYNLCGFYWSQLRAG